MAFEGVYIQIYIIVNIYVCTFVLRGQQEMETVSVSFVVYSHDLNMQQLNF